MNASEPLPDILWNEFGSALQMLENAIVACPPEVWGDEISFSAFWYIAYHTLFWLDFYASESPEGFQPPAPFTLDEFDPAGVLPQRIYSKEELLTYLAHGRAKSRALIGRLTPEKMQQRFVNERKNLSLLQLVLYNMRHLQHHAAQLNLLLRQRTDSAPNWVSRPDQGLHGSKA
ncbi:DinB family protein [Deinococcus sp.]|uniref:DinB family protein n=1 Tax=Deinococcus sp. TaxID=47478 RepID=UPI003B5CD517